MVFVDGTAHKLDQVSFNIPMKSKKYTTRGSCCGPSGDQVDTLDLIEDYMSPWTFSSNDGRFEIVEASEKEIKVEQIEEINEDGTEATEQQS